jgi:hypothetical protein
MSALIEKLRFAMDSPVEGAGFEPSVPPTRVISCPATHAEPPEDIVRANLGAGGAAQLDLFWQSGGGETGSLTRCAAHGMN